MTGEILRSVSFDAWTAAAAGIMERIDNKLIAQRYPHALAPKVAA